jgi:hypothetical protein
LERSLDVFDSVTEYLKAIREGAQPGATATSRRRISASISAHDLAVRLAHLTHLIRDIIAEAYANEAAFILQPFRIAFAPRLTVAVVVVEHEAADHSPLFALWPK